jgi:hypothetical protein
MKPLGVLSMEERFKNLKIALIFDNLKLAQPISDQLREIGIFAEVYHEVETFWVASKTEKVDLVFAGVESLLKSSVELSLHQDIQDEKLSVVICYNSENQNFLNHEFNLKLQSFLNTEALLAPQIINQLNGALNSQKNNEKVEGYKAEMHKAHLNMRNIQKEVSEVYNFEEQFVKYQTLCSGLEPCEDLSEYLNMVSNTLNHWQDCERFAMVELDSSHRKLLSPKIVLPKYHHLPMLATTDECQRGINPFTVDMAASAAMNHLGHDLVVVPVYGRYENPELLIFVKPVTSELIDFRWDLLSDSFSLIYKNMFLSNRDIHKTESHFDFWLAMDEMDDVFYHNKKAQTKLININLRPLMNLIQRSSANRFNWLAFKRSFSRGISEMISSSEKFTFNGVSDVLVFVETRNVDSQYQLIKAFVEDFEYWQFFSDVDTVIKSLDIPKIEMIKQSSVNYLRETMADSRLEPPFKNSRLRHLEL